MAAMSSERIKLNVGGTMFETTRSTILKLNSGYLEKLLDSKSGFQQPTDDVWFIDRDPECFRIILNIARYGEVCTMSKSVNAEVLAREADFYLLGPEIIAIILRHVEAQRNKEEKTITLMKSILSVTQEAIRELQLVKGATQELVRGMASQAYWTS